jgi:hypothetical protein
MVLNCHFIACALTGYFLWVISKYFKANPSICIKLWCIWRCQGVRNSYCFLVRPVNDFMSYFPEQFIEPMFYK